MKSDSIERWSKVIANVEPGYAEYMVSVWCKSNASEEHQTNNEGCAHSKSLPAVTVYFLYALAPRQQLGALAQCGHGVRLYLGNDFLLQQLILVRAYRRDARSF